MKEYINLPWQWGKHSGSLLAQETYHCATLHKMIKCKEQITIIANGECTQWRRLECRSSKCKNVGVVSNKGGQQWRKRNITLLVQETQHYVTSHKTFKCNEQIVRAIDGECTQWRQLECESSKHKSVVMMCNKGERWWRKHLCFLQKQIVGPKE